MRACGAPCSSSSTRWESLAFYGALNAGMLFLSLAYNLTFTVPWACNPHSSSRKCLAHSSRNKWTLLPAFANFAAYIQVYSRIEGRAWRDKDG